LLRSLPLALLLAGAGTLWRHHAPPPHSISYEPPEIRPEGKPAPGPIPFGPAWPPTDEDWRFAFERVAFTYPLPGPIRRLPVIDPSRRGVDLGGELWGEQVYAVYEGVVDRAQRGGNEDGEGQYVRLSHFGGMVFTQYSHLAALPRGLTRGARIKAGDIIGLLGDTGMKGPGRHLHFTLSIRPSSELPEVYWDPRPLMPRWSLRLPPHGTVAGFSPATGAIAATAKPRLNY
jgi:murein DD-endopeptidase MepM/ murein hydrolase activator NlpD